MFQKFGEAIELTSANIQSAESVLSIMTDAEITAKFQKFAGELNRIAPKANDFLYFSAVMMHAAEASAINLDGTQKLASGKPVQVGWEKKGESWRWMSSDPSLKPYKNSNGDIFPEEELLKAYKNWIGKPLCVDHKSSSVDAIRGVILDTYYDRIHKRVIALCALDKVSYPDLARKVSTGYSTCVSMGTAVERAICSDCGQVAKAENDFCIHMRTKSCYGEINVGLNPIELSIVVNGADPKAKIRTILAAADHLNNYILRKQQEFTKISSEDEHLGKLQELEEDLKKVTGKLAELKSAIEKDEVSEDSGAEPPYGMSSGTLAESETDLSNTDSTLNVPARFASNNDALVSELESLRSSLETRFKNMENNLDILSHKLKEEIMSAKDATMNKEAYFQGAGEENEPTPGKPKYDKDPLNEKLRSEDKHMVGQHNLDTGPVDGMHPGPDSAHKSDEERKKLLQRAEVDQRALRRAAALQRAKESIMPKREAYFQGGGEENEPTPGKPKYPKDPLQEKLRDKEDKQMVGQKPFPGVGDVEGLHPSPLSADQKDELARKKLLQRASLKARFVRVANADGTDNLGDSAWHVYVGDKLALAATVDEISGGNAEVLFDTIATKDFGSKMLEKIRAVGLNKATSLYKRAQAVGDMGAQPGAPADAGGAGPMPAGAGPMPADPGGAPPGGDAGAPADEDDTGSGDPKEVALKLAQKVRDMSSDLLEAVRALTGEQAEMGDLEGMEEAPKTAGVSVASLQKMRKELNGALISALKKSVAELNEHEEELHLISSVFEDGTTTDYVETLAEDAFTDAKKSLADSYRLMAAFCKYARGTDNLIKHAETQGLVKAANDDENAGDDMGDMGFGDDMGMHMGDEDGDELADLLKDEPGEEHEEHEDHEEHEGLKGLEGLDEEMPELPGDTNDVMLDIDPASLANKKVEIKASEEYDVTTKEGRAAFRAKLAAQSVEFSDMLDESSALADGQTQLDVKPSDDLGYIETVEEQHQADMELAEAPPKVREAAERINQLIVEGKITAAEVDGLVAHGVDPAAVKYWKQFWGEAGKEGNGFAAELVKEHAKAQMEEEIKTHKVKISRAFNLANEMVRRGLLANDDAAIASQVDEIMTWNDEGFESMKRVVAKHSLKKEASIPQVGLIGSGDTFSQNPTEHDLQSALDGAFANRRY